MKDKPVILVVDDQPQNVELLEAYLLPGGYEIVKAANGEEALEKLSGNQIDLLLLDIMMPGMDGFEVTRRVRQDIGHPSLPIILVTALKDTEDRIKGIEAGCDDFLSKPVDKTELLARVKSLLKVKDYNELMSNYRKELESEVTGRTEELRLAFERIKAASLDTIYRLSMASEYKDEDTGAHIKRMSRYSAAVARRMGLDENTIETILYASPMHDLGKIGIPDHILVKPAKLDHTEWEIMKLHTVIGARILKGSDAEFIKLGEVIAQSHHEKWDGSGYPDGLKGNEIPISGRITAIADVFDALTSKRPYKEPFSEDRSLAIIKDGRGSHFDPDVVDAFFAIQDEILAIKKQYADDTQRAFDIPELKALLSQHNLQGLRQETTTSDIESAKSNDLVNSPELRYRKLIETAERDSAIAKIASQLFSSVSIEDTSRLILENAERFTYSAYGFVGYIDKDLGYVMSPVMTGGAWDLSPGQDETSIFKKPAERWLESLNKRQSLFTNAAAEAPGFMEAVPDRIPMQNFLSAPALIGTELVGQVILANSNRDYNRLDLEFVERLAALYAVAIQHQRTEDKIRKMAYHDPLTGLPNRSLFNDRYTIARAGAKRYQKKIGLLVLDIDNFKNINDTLGHGAGDEVLKYFSGTLLSILRQTDTVMRSGGDEFAIMITDAVELKNITDVAQKILETTRQPFVFQDHKLRITASIGISSYPEDGEDIETLLKCADIAMYHIKDTGRDNYASYVPGMKTQVLG